MRNEEEQLRLRLRQAAERANRQDRPVPERFVTGEERAWAVHEARQAGVEVAFDGGWPDAERVQACFFPAGDGPEFTGVWLEIRWPSKFVRCDHRDLLGSLMALGMDRSFFGDLIAAEDHACLLTTPEMAQRLPGEWLKAGSAPLTVRAMEEPPTIEAPQGAMLRDTVPSLRLDAIVSSGMKLSRARAAELIREGAVAVEHRQELRTDRPLAEGQLLSIRGFGRIRLREVGQMTRKERLPVLLEIFRKS